MSRPPNHPKLTLTLLRIQGKRVPPTQWTTNSSSIVLSNAHPLFAQYATNDIYVGDKHLELLYEHNHWSVKHIHASLGSSLNGEQLIPNKLYPVQNNHTIEIGLCQIHISDQKYINDTADLKQLLLIDDLASTGLATESIELADNQSGAVHHIGQTRLDDKTTFEDLGLGTHFNEQAFFNEVQSETSRLSAFQHHSTDDSIKTLDILDQLAIESEIAIINPSLLSKNADYWRGQTKQDFVNNKPIPELEHLFAIEHHQDDRMLPLDNSNHINALLSNHTKLDVVIPDLSDTNNYSLFAGETGHEPLRLFSMQHQDLHAYIPQSTPNFTQKEHHASSMDGHFAVSNGAHKTPSHKPTNAATEPTDNWLNTFSASLNDKASADDILDALTQTPHKDNA